MYPRISDPNLGTSPSRRNSSSVGLYPTIDTKNLVENLFPDGNEPETYPYPPSAPPETIEETLISISAAILHLIDSEYSVELATGDLRILRLRQGSNTVAALAAVSDDIQWPLTKDLSAVKLDSSHYFFTFKPPHETEDSDSSDEEEKKNLNKSNNPGSAMLSYGLTIVSKGQKGLLKELDVILETYCTFSVHKVNEKAVLVEGGVAARDVSVNDLKTDRNKKQAVEGQCAAYWTILAPNVEEYSGTVARLIAAGSGQLIKGVLWCGDVTVDRLKKGNDIMIKRMAPGGTAEIDPNTLKRIKRVKRVTKMTENVASGVLSGAVKVTGFFTGSIANSKIGKKFFGLLPGEIILASLDGFSKICDAVEVAGKNVMSTSSTVTTGLVTHRYGEEAGKATSEGLDAAGHAIGTAWTVFKIRKALNPKSVLKPTALAKSAAESAATERKGKRS
ncbi:protein EARLY-RESPONSIVE TO DEHYDRATION 7, chloroplastic-like [Primulina eburnea]|uniref:protein EARLY-RESPONSIVE TO DEHYDRATION 7, chloroplastic-like n=1 Tax=Primulina eburnea TaxID=1245227 RepID=UPI003C6C727D